MFQNIEFNFFAQAKNKIKIIPNNFFPTYTTKKFTYIIFYYILF